jgi:hypothetical protein
MRRLLQPWIPIGRISVLANLHGGAARFRTIVAGRSWALLWVRRDLSMPATPPESRPTMREAIDQADAASVPTGEQAEQDARNALGETRSQSADDLRKHLGESTPSNPPVPTTKETP